MAKGSFDLRAWALIGAQQRLNELEDERRSILASFPQLRGGAGGRRGRKPASDASGEAAAKGKGRRRRRKLSAEARRRISEAQKARWAKQKQKKA